MSQSSPPMSTDSMSTDPRNLRSTVLVAVVNNIDDLQRTASQGWYRIPQRRAPRRIGADYLAFYQTGAFRGQEEAHTVTYYAATRRYRLLTRRELLPQEADHPRADDFYFRIELGPLLRLEKPLPAKNMRRITFIHTTLDRLLRSEDVKDLFIKDDPFDAFWQTLRANRLRPLANRIFEQQPIDITLRARGGYVGIRWQTRPENSAEEKTRQKNKINESTISENIRSDSGQETGAAAAGIAHPDATFHLSQSSSIAAPGVVQPGSASVDTAKVDTAEVDTTGPVNASSPVRRARWELLTLSPAQFERDPDECLRHIGAALIRLGGSDLNRG